ncbi:MAG: hypothetical protein KZQ91_15575 [Candidatus Thiodiazotropha sp. (ex Lucinoma borealis)]|nr:hypothetical protein [Candidatus Thiodiazotropha sp. (ex Lucinoma borealis)]
MSYSYTPIELLPCQSALTLFRPYDFSPEAGTGRTASTDEHCNKADSILYYRPSSHFTVAD